MHRPTTLPRCVPQALAGRGPHTPHPLSGLHFQQLWPHLIPCGVCDVSRTTPMVARRQVVAGLCLAQCQAETPLPPSMRLGLGGEVEGWSPPSGKFAPPDATMTPAGSGDSSSRTNGGSPAARAGRSCGRSLVSRRGCAGGTRHRWVHNRGAGLAALPSRGCRCRANLVPPGSACRRGVGAPP